jgi:hypothetical protein
VYLFRQNRTKFLLFKYIFLKKGFFPFFPTLTGSKIVNLKIFMFTKKKDVTGCRKGPIGSTNHQRGKNPADGSITLSRTNGH